VRLSRWRQGSSHSRTATKEGADFHNSSLYSSLAEKRKTGLVVDRWLTPRLVKMGLDEKGMGWHSFKRFRKTWLRGQRCLEDINNFWMAHKPQTMSEVYSHLHEELEMRLAEAERVGYRFDLPVNPTAAFVPIVPKNRKQKLVEVAA
jgi:hypothetical protein